VTAPAASAVRPDHDPPYDPRRRAEISGFGLKLFLAGLSCLFLATIIGYVVVMVGGSGTQFLPGERADYDTARRWSEGWDVARTPGAQVPATPLSSSVWAGLAGATAVIVASSLTIALALRALRVGSRRAFLFHLRSTLLLAFVFLGVQIGNWMQIAAELPLDEGRLRTATFYLLTGTHALHVLGGLVPMVIVVARAGRGAYGPDDWVGVRNVAWYWHFLDVVWLLMLAVMLVVRH
jgi:cytochrome c oxidase subunit III